METEYAKIDPLNMDQEVIKKGAALIRQGEVVAFPTETVYGLGANALDTSGVAKIFQAKGRPMDNPLIVHVAEISQIDPLVDGRIPLKAQKLMAEFWPGPLTLIFPKSSKVPRAVTAGLNTVAVRMPRHPIALALIKEAGVPVAAPSANISGLPSPTEGSHVWADLKGKIPLIIDGGATVVGLESTVLDFTVSPPLILRPGGITLEEIRETLGEVAFDPGIEEDISLNGQDIPRAPGMKYTHYAPKAKVFIIAGDEDDRIDKIQAQFVKWQEAGKRVALLLSAEVGEEWKRTQETNPCYFEILGTKDNLSSVGKGLFAALRSSDAHYADIILVEAFPETGVGKAIMNRLYKAAGQRVIY